MPAIGQYYVELSVRGLAGVHAALGSVRRGLTTLATTATAPIRALGNALGGLLTPTGLVGMALGAAGVAGTRGILSLAAQAENLSTQFEVLLGSSEAAKRMMEDINRFAATTPYEQLELGDVAKQLLAYGTATEDIIPVMRQLGDIASLSGASLGDLAAIYGRVQAQGRLTAQTLEMWQVRGIPITRELAAVLGVAENQVRELVSQGQVGFEHVKAAISRLADEGGQFAGGMQRLSRTAAGLWSTVTGNLKTALAELGNVFIETFNIKPMLAALGEWLGNLGGRIQRLGAQLRDFLAQWRSTFVQSYETAVAIFGAFWEVVSGMFSAIWGVLSSVFGTLFVGLLRDSTSSFQETINSWLAAVQFFFENWRLYLAIGWEQFKLWCENLWVRIKALFQNMGVLLKWFMENWRDVLTDVWNVGKTVFSNLIKNLKGLWNAFWTWIKGGKWEFNWTPLTEGFSSAIKKMPEFVEAEIKETTPALEALKAELEKRRKEFYERKAKPPAEAPPPATPSPAAPAAPAAEAAKQAAGAAAEAHISFVALEALAQQMQEEVAQRQNEAIARATQQTAEATEKLASAVDGNVVRVEVVAGHIPATYS